ncbi:MAG: hypothetical protein A2017_05105 [Lentisphaerae bacterium GWF2_44_16]|nr:MAG: hypothetical protein A2017_05105 [Lentisphaerae bacterium GWF2_44_16]
MKKSLIIHIVVMIVAIICGSYLALHLNQEQGRLMPSKKLTNGAPMLGGFQKIASDVEWMLFINYMGSLKSVDQSNVKDVIERLEKILGYDPNFEKAYQVGVLSLTNEAPGKAVEILDKACQNDDLKNNWQLPFYAGFILTHAYNFIKETGTEAELRERKIQRAKQAVKFFEMAIKRSPKPEQYVVNSYIRAQAKAMNPDNDKMAALQVLFNTWNKQQGDMEMETSIIPDLNQKIIKAAQELKENSPDDPKAKELIEIVIKKVFKDQHICQKCLFTYATGDKFCQACGEKVEVYGVCPKCNAVLKGQYCSSCGFNARPPKPAEKKVQPKVKPEAKKADVKKTDAKKGK